MIISSVLIGFNLLLFLLIFVLSSFPYLVVIRPLWFVGIEVVCGGMIVIVEFLCSSIGTLQSYLMLFAKYTSCKCNLHRKTFLIFNVLLFTSSFLLMGIVYSQFFVIFLLSSETD